MEVQEDFRELLILFNSHGVEYLITGAHTLAFYGAPRYTGDLDLLVRPSRVNAARIIAALTVFGFGELGLTADDFALPGQIIQLGFPPVRIDLITSLTGVSWEEADSGTVSADFGGVPVSYLGKRQFIINKRATGRLKDLADLEALEETAPCR